MAPKGALAAAAVVVVFNLGTLGHVALNRSGEPEAVLELTERELSLPPREAENTSLALRLEWVDPEALRPGAGWFDQRKLQEVGFDCSPTPTDANRDHYRGMAPRAAYAVLEYEGDSWRRYLAEPALPAPTGWPHVTARRAEPEPAKRSRGSHLVLVDVGTNPAALRARYPDRRRHLVAPATVLLLFVQEPGRAPYLEGRVGMVVPMQLNVPRDQRRLLERLQTERRKGAEGDATGEPRYRATVNWGRALEPWLADVQLLSANR